MTALNRKTISCYLENTTRSRIGERNLENLVKLGVDHVDFSINPKIEKQLFTNHLF